MFSSEMRHIARRYGVGGKWELCEGDNGPIEWFLDAHTIMR